MLKEFFAVTLTSIYKVVSSNEKGQPEMEKLAIRPQTHSKVVVGRKMGGPMISIGRQLISFEPVGEGITSVERELGKVNEWYWLNNTSFVAALFLNEKDEVEYFTHNTPVVCDPVARDKTMEVLAAIGKDHPQFSISKCENTRLPL